MTGIYHNDMPLSEHFRLGEFLKSRTAEQHQPKPIPNIPLKRHITAMQNLAVRCLEPTRRHFGLPIQINSGYRCEMVNRLVGGVGNSQHLLGEAADITIPRKYWPFGLTTSEQVARLLFRWMRDELPTFDQLILENAGSSWWVHVSCRIEWRKNRKQVMMIVA